MFYNQLKKICREHGTSPTSVCHSLGISSGNVSRWARGTYPRLDTLLRIADYLEEPVGAFCFDEDMYGRVMPRELAEWEAVIRQIPVEKWPMCIDFLKTHMAAPADTSPPADLAPSDTDEE